MKKNIAIALLLLLSLVLLWRYLATGMRVYHLKGTVQTIATVKDSALASTNVVRIVESMDYILCLTPDRDGRSQDRDFGVLLDSYISDAIAVMVARLRELTGRDLGPNPKAWIRAYAPGRFTENAHSERK